MKNARHVIALTLVATAMCADRSLPARPAEQASAHFAGRLIERLSVNFRRVVPAFQPYRPQRFGLASEHAMAPAPTLAAVWVSRQISPFQFRLPPPIG